MRVLYVCTANICRSPSAERLLRDAVAAAPPLAEIEVRSAGTSAIAGRPGCSVAPALTGYAHEHHSQPLTAALVGWADLVLPAAREHRAAILDLVPGARARTFTVRQAGRIADWMWDAGLVVAARERREATHVGEAHDDEADRGDPRPSTPWTERFPPGDPRREVPALPDELAQRWRWLVSELDAARGLSGAPHRPEHAKTDGDRRPRLLRPRRSKEPTHAASTPTRDTSPGSGDAHPDDIPDPHALGPAFHTVAYDEIKASTDALVRLLRQVAAPA